MSTQLKIWKRLITNQLPLLCHCPSTGISLLPSLPFYTKHPIKFANFCNQIAIPSTASLENGVVNHFLINKCGLTEEEITKTFRHRNNLHRITSTQNFEEIMELLNGCGLTTPAQIRRVVLRNPKILFLRSERNLKPKLSFLRTVLKEEDISKLVSRDASIFSVAEDKLKSRVSLFLRSGFDGKTLSNLVAKGPRVLKISEEKVMELFEQVENLGFKMGSKSFAAAFLVILGQTKETIERKLQCLRCLGFSEKQISGLSSRAPQVLSLSVEKLKRNFDFMVNSAGLPLDDFVKYHFLFTSSLERRIVPRYKVMETLKSMQMQEFKKDIYLPTVFYLTEKHFLEKYVNNHPESSFLLDIYHGRKGGDTL